MEHGGDPLSAAIAIVLAGVPFAAAIALASLVMVAAVGVSASTARVDANIRLTAILAVLCLGSGLSVALSGRVLVSELELALKPWLAVSTIPGDAGIRASQISTLIVLTLSAAEWIRWASGSGSIGQRGRAVWFAMIWYFLVTVVISGLAGVYRDPSLNVLYMPFVLTAVGLLGDESQLPDVWRRLRWVVVLPCASSLVAIWLMPRLALEPDYKSLVPGLHFRLHGMAEHANSLGMLATVGLLLESSRFVRDRPSLVFLAVHGTVLLLAQSKTAWVATLICLPIVRWDWIRNRFWEGDRWRSVVLVTISALIVTAVTVLTLVQLSGSASLMRAVDDSGISTLTGRTDVWRITLEELQRSPLFGYGPSLWDIPYRTERGLMNIGQAHNQFVQTLGQAGLLGGGALVCYLTLMWLRTIAARKATSGLGLAVVVLLTVRCVSESPMRMAGILGFDSWFHVLAFATAVGAREVLVTRRQSTAQRADSVAP